MSMRRLPVLLAALVVLAAPATARADTVTDWNLHASNALMNTAAQAPPVATIHMAMVHGAMYDAVNAIDGQFEAYVYPGRRAAFWASKDAAAATAAYRVLVSLVPSQQAQLEELYNASLAALPDTSAKWIGVSIGGRAADAMIEARTNDGRFGAPGFPTGTLPGQWRPVPPALGNDPNGWVRDVRPFLMQSASQFQSAGPFSLTSTQYAAEFNEVKAVGSLNSATRTAVQTNAARYWAENPPRTWGRIVRMISAQELLSLESNARLYAMLYTTTADAFISVWDDKARWGFWRPITAIREANLDGNPATTADPEWVSLTANPPYPEHPSGHLGLSGSFVTTLQQFLGRDDIGWTDTNVGGLTTTYTSLSGALAEIVDVRVWSGIHFRRADEHSVLIAQQIADWREANYFRETR